MRLTATDLVPFSSIYQKGLKTENSGCDPAASGGARDILADSPGQASIQAAGGTW